MGGEGWGGLSFCFEHQPLPEKAQTRGSEEGTICHCQRGQKWLGLVRGEGEEELNREWKPCARVTRIPGALKV